MERYDNSLDYESLPDTQEATQERLSLEPIAPEEEEQAKPWGRLVSFNPDVGHYLLYDNITTIGRANTCSLTLSDSYISGRHCKLEREEDDNGDGAGALAFLTDTSSNGTFLNSEMIGKGNKRMLKHNDTISLVHAAPDKLAFLYEDYAAAANKPAWLEGIAPHYDIIKELGAGNFSVVKLGVSKKTGEKVALKIIDKMKYWNMSKTTEQLAREVDILQKLKHKHVIQVHDCIETDRWLYLVLELATGGDLFENLKEREKFTEVDARRIFKQILDALKYLHENGTAHRDLKPENILLENDGPDAIIKLTDFGLARIVDRQGMMNTLCGTPQYVAPEVLLAAQGFSSGGYGVAVDMWSAGVLLYILLSGFPPFNEELDMPLYEQIQAGLYSFLPKDVWVNISREAKDLITKLMEVNAGTRLDVKGALAHPWFSVELKPENVTSPLQAAVPLDHVQRNLKKTLSQASPSYHNSPTSKSLLDKRKAPERVVETKRARPSGLRKSLNFDDVK